MQRRPGQRQGGIGAQHERSTRTSAAGVGGAVGRCTALAEPSHEFPAFRTAGEVIGDTARAPFEQPEGSGDEIVSVDPTHHCRPWEIRPPAPSAPDQRVDPTLEFHGRAPHRLVSRLFAPRSSRRRRSPMHAQRRSSAAVRLRRVPTRRGSRRPHPVDRQRAGCNQTVGARVTDCAAATSARVGPTLSESASSMFAAVGRRSTVPPPG